MAHVDLSRQTLRTTLPSFDRWRRSKVVAVLALADAVSAFISLAILAGLVELFGYRLFDSPATILAGLVLAICLHLLFGVYEGGRAAPVERFRSRVLSAIIFAMTMTIVIAQTIPFALASACFVILLGIEILMEAVTSEFARKFLVGRDLWREPVVVIGPFDESQRLVRRLEDDPESAFRPVGAAAQDALTFDGPRPWAAAGINGAAPLQDVRCALLLSTGNQQVDMELAVRIDLPSVIILKEIGALQTLWLHSRSIDNAFGIEVTRSLLVAGNLRLKRIFDLALAIPLTILSLPVICVCALAVFAVDPANPFYSQARIGQKMKSFEIFKLRTMYRDAEARLAAQLSKDPAMAEEWQRNFKLARDPRILPVVGGFLRRSSLDELPQLFNVLKGEMSLVGPRPFPAYHLASFDEEFCAFRASVIPGLSGLWQITERSDGDLAAQKRWDTYYIRNWSIWLDLWILLYTLPAVALARGAR